MLVTRASSTCPTLFNMQMENIGFFLDACYAYGLTKVDMFQTVDLYDGTNIPQVWTDGLIVLRYYFGTCRSLMVFMPWGEK